MSEVETLAVLGAGGFGRVTLVRYKGEQMGGDCCCLRSINNPRASSCSAVQ